MKGMPTYTLSGLDKEVSTAPLFQEFDNISDGLSGVNKVYEKFLAATKRNLENTLEVVINNPSYIEILYPAQKFIDITKYVLANWENEETRTIALAQAGKMLSSVEKTMSPALNGWLKDQANKVVDKVKSTVDNVFDEINTRLPIVKKVADKAGDVKEKVVSVVKKAGEAILRYNPLSLLIKAGILGAMYVNLFKMGSRVFIGYVSRSEAVKAGYDGNEWTRAKKGLDVIVNIYSNQLKGKESDLKKAVLNPITNSDRTLSGLGAAGEELLAALPTIATIVGKLAAIGAMVLNRKDKDGNSAPIEPTNLPDNPPKLSPGEAARIAAETKKAAALLKKTNEDEAAAKNMYQLIGAIGVPVLLATGYYFYQRNN